MDQLQELVTKLKYDGDTTKALFDILDEDGDGMIDEQEWLMGLDKGRGFKEALAKDVDPETGKLKCLTTASKAIFNMLRRQEGKYFIDKKEVGRYVKALKAVYKPTDDCDAVIAELMGSTETMSPEDWDTLLESKMPDLKAKLEADYRPERVRFNSYRSCGQQLSKLLGNLDRLRWKQARGEDVAAEIESRKKQVAKMRANGILPSPGIAVFNQLDFD